MHVGAAFFRRISLHPVMLLIPLGYRNSPFISAANADMV
jgi:hypothetical protein